MAEASGPRRVITLGIPGLLIAGALGAGGLAAAAQASTRSAPPAPERLLDYASGHVEFIAAVPAGEGWAVDRVNYSDSRLAGVRITVADIMDAYLPDKYFDGVFASAFVEHLPEQDAIGAP